MVIKLRLDILLLILLTLLISGCWDQVEIKERTIVIGLGVDKIPGPAPFLLTVQVVNFSTSKSSGAVTGMGAVEKNSSNQNSSVTTSTGRSFYEAIHNFLKYPTHRIMFSHNRVVVFGNALARSGNLTGILDEMMRDYQFRRTNWVLVAKNTAQEILRAQTDLGMLPAKELDQMIINLSKKALIQPVNLNDLLIGLNRAVPTGLAPLVEIEKTAMNPTPRITINKTAIFKNNRLFHVLTEEESQGLIWLANRQKGSTLVVSDPSNQNRTSVSVELSKGKTQIRPRLVNNAIMFDIVCTGIGVLRESEHFTNNAQTTAQLERRIEKLLQNNVAGTIRKSQQIKVDFLGFADLIQSEFPEHWRRLKPDWAATFPQVRSRVRFQIKLVSFGLVKDSVLKNGRQE